MVCFDNEQKGSVLLPLALFASCDTSRRGDDDLGLCRAELNSWLVELDAIPRKKNQTNANQKTRAKKLYIYIYIYIQEACVPRLIQSEVTYQTLMNE